MKLSNVNIVNFRSIENATIDFNHKCRILVGINEAGKSNVLKALALLSNNIMPVDSDVRQDLHDEKQITESYVEFKFNFEPKDIQRCVTLLEKSVLSKGGVNTLIFERGKKLSLSDFCNTRDTAAYHVDVMAKEKSAKYFYAPRDLVVLPGWKKPSKECPPAYNIHCEDGAIPLAKFGLIYLQDYPDIPENYLEDIDIETVNDLIGDEICKIVVDNLPECIYWQYDLKNLLPDRIPKASFMANPETCMPLKNMFELAGINNIKEYISTQSKRMPYHGFKNALEKVSGKATEHVHKIWKEYTDIEISLVPDGEHIIAAIKDKHNSYPFAMRSDGFKRFITFLLMISAQVKTDQLVDTLVLIDEPEVSLHPKGSQALRDELIKISEKNYVVYSTHSIFMIDGNEIERHVIISKKEEKTITTLVNNSNFIEEEVLFNALGCSMFYGLKDINLIFEGWRDKALFDVATKKYSADYKDLKKSFDNYGHVYVKGVKDVCNVTSLLKLANKECIILSDDDSMAKIHQKEFKKEYSGYGEWKRYTEISPGMKVVTGEDFFKERHFIDIVNDVFVKNALTISITPGDLDENRGRLSVITGILQKQMVAEDIRKQVISEIKTELVNTANNADVDIKYYTHLRNLKSVIEGLYPK